MTSSFIKTRHAYVVRMSGETELTKPKTEKKKIKNSSNGKTVIYPSLVTLGPSSDEQRTEMGSTHAGARKLWGRSIAPRSRRRSVNSWGRVLGGDVRPVSQRSWDASKR